MKPSKSAFKARFVNQILKNSKQLLFGFLVAVVVFAGFNFGGEVRVSSEATAADADKIAIKINNGNSFGRAVVTGGIYRGLISCYEKTSTAPDVGDWFKRATLEEFNNSCSNFVLAGETVGEPYKGSNNQIFNTRSDSGSGVRTIRNSQPYIFFTSKGYVLQDIVNNTTKTLTSDEIRATPGCASVISCIENPTVAQAIADKFGPALSQNISAGRTFKTELESIGGVNPLTEAGKTATSISTNGATCSAFLDADKKPVFRCRDKDGKPTGPNGTALPATCTAKSTQGDIVFRYDNQTVVCDITAQAQDAIFKSNTEDRTIGTAVKQEGLLDPLGSILFKIVSWILALLLLLIGNAGLFILWAMGGFVLWILSQNPGTPAFVTLLSGPWGILVGIGNLMVLAAFLYTGFGYLLGISNMKKDLGEFLQKIIYYALILNFTLYGLATLVNVGYGLGNLIKVSYSSSAKNVDINGQLIGNLLNGIGKVSTIRCGTLAADCIVINDKGETTQSQDSKTQFDKLFGINSESGSESKAITAIVMEFVAIGLMIVAGVVLWRALYTTFYRFIGILFIMMLSPIGAASMFSPIDSWQSIGKQMWEKFWKMVAFYPAFIFGLILVNLLSSQFAEVNPVTSGSSGSLEQSLTVLLTKIVGAGISIMGLWLITDYFAKSFEEDMSKIGSGVKSVASSTWDGLQKVGKFGNGVVKLGGGTVANAGRLVSFGANVLGAKKLFKAQADDASRRAEELAKEIESGVDSKGRKLSKSDKDERLKSIKYLRRKEDNYRDLQRRGLGRSFISAGNTIGYSGDRAVSTAKNVASFFGKVGETFKAEDDVYWQTQSNRAMKRLGMEDAADVIFSGAANVGVSADAEAALAQEAAAKGLANPFDNILNDQREDAIKGALGLKDRKLRRDVAQKLIPYLVKQASGDLEKLSQAEQRLLEQVTDLAADDEQLGRELFGNKDGAALLQQMTARNMITNNNTATKLAENWGNTLGTQDERLDAGARLAKDQRAFEKVDKSIFNDPDVLEGYKRAMNGDLSAIGKSKGRFGSLHDNESIDAAKDFVAQIAPVTGTKEFRDRVQSATSSIQDNFRNSAFSGHQDVLYELANLHSQDLDDATFKTGSDEIMAKAFKQQFGISDDNAKKLLEKNGAVDVIQSAEVNAMFDAGKDKTKAKAMVDKLVAESDIALYAQNNVKGFGTMDSLEQLEAIKQATLQQMVSANRNVDTYRAKANTTAAELSTAKKKGARRAKVHETAKKATDAITAFTSDPKKKFTNNDAANIANLQRAMVSGDAAKIRTALAAVGVSDPTTINDAIQIGDKAILANGASKMKGDLEDAFATGSVDEMAKFLVENLGVDPAISKATAKEIRRQAGSSASVQADIIDEFTEAMAKFAQNPRTLDKETIDVLNKFGADPVAKAAEIRGALETNAGKVFGGVAGSIDPNGILERVSGGHKSNAGKAYGDTLKPVKELDPDFITQS